MYVDRPSFIVIGDCVCCDETLTVDCREFDNGAIPDAVVCNSCREDSRNAPVIAELECRAVRRVYRAQPVVEPVSAQVEQHKLLEALRLCVASLDQLLPYLAKVPADIGLLNNALIAGRAALAAQGGGE